MTSCWLFEQALASQTPRMTIRLTFRVIAYSTGVEIESSPDGSTTPLRWAGQLFVL